MITYLDHAASSPLRPEALAVYARAADVLGNPSSVHRAGQSAKLTIEQARDDVARTLGADPVEIVFTGSGTEAVNMAIKGTYWARNSKHSRPIVVVPEGEHHATLDAVEWLERRENAVLRWVPLDSDGTVNAHQWALALADNPDGIALATLIWANNEIGTVQPVSELVRVAAKMGVPVHIDAIAAYGHERIDVHALRRDTHSGPTGLSTLSVSAHKIGGPQGIGALFVARDAVVEPLVHGGGQQRKLRSGTEDVLSTAAFGAAATAMSAHFEAENARMRALRDDLMARIEQSIPDARINGSRNRRLSNNVHVTFAGCESDSLLFLLDTAGFAVSSGSACQAGVTEVSHVVQALGFSEEDSRGSLRVTLGPQTTIEDISRLMDVLPGVVQQARAAGLSARATRFDS